MVAQRFFRECIELTGRDILLKLLVPDLPVVSKKPFAEGREFLGGKVFNLALELFDITHDGTS